MRRVLQVVAVPDGRTSAAAAGLHRFLVAQGLEVRSLAGGPAASGSPPTGVDLPPMAPSGRSPAALAQLRREVRWADVLVLRGRRAAVLALGGGPRTVWCLDDLRPATRVPRRPVGALVVPTDSAVGVVARHGRTPAVLPPVVVPFPLLPPAARTEARAVLGLPADARIARLRQVSDRRGARLVLQAAGWTTAPDDAPEEVLRAVTEVVVHESWPTTGPSVEVLDDVLAGATPVAVDGTDWGAGAADRDRLRQRLDELGDADVRLRAAEAAAAHVLDVYGSDAAGAEWLSLLTSIAAG